MRTRGRLTPGRRIGDAGRRNTVGSAAVVLREATSRCERPPVGGRQVRADAVAGIGIGSCPRRWSGAIEQGGATRSVQFPPFRSRDRPLGQRIGLRGLAQDGALSVGHKARQPRRVRAKRQQFGSLDAVVGGGRGRILQLSDRRGRIGNTSCPSLRISPHALPCAGRAALRWSYSEMPTVRKARRQSMSSWPMRRVMHQNRIRSLLSDKTAAIQRIRVKSRT